MFDRFGHVSGASIRDQCISSEGVSNTKTSEQGIDSLPSRSSSLLSTTSPRLRRYARLIHPAQLPNFLSPRGLRCSLTDVGISGPHRLPSLHRSLRRKDRAKRQSLTPSDLRILRRSKSSLNFTTPLVDHDDTAIDHTFSIDGVALAVADTKADPADHTILESENEQPETHVETYASKTANATEARLVRDTGVSLDAFGARDSCSVYTWPIEHAAESQRPRSGNHSVDSPLLTAIETEGRWVSNDLAEASWLDDDSAREDVERASLDFSYIYQDVLQCEKSTWLDDESEGSSSIEYATMAVPGATQNAAECSAAGSSNGSESSSECESELSPDETVALERGYPTPLSPNTHKRVGFASDALSIFDDKARIQSMEYPSSTSPTLVQTPSTVTSSPSTSSWTQDLLDLIPLLEYSIAGFPAGMLQLDSPIITLLRNTRSAGSDSSRGYRDFNSTTTEHHLAYFQSIFPHTSAFLLSSLYAHLLALNHIISFRASSVYIALTSPPRPAPTLSKTPSILSRPSALHQPPTKALALLGLHSPIKPTPTSASTPTAPATPSREEALAQRIARLERGLRTCVRKLMLCIGVSGNGTAADPSMRGVILDDEELGDENEAEQGPEDELAIVLRQVVLLAEEEAWVSTVPEE
ncbi:MAG: hypothetical protein M1838_000258 [Thelocarpon superellum]|nr:MAG: hypothetical protein M1838_000258 [Thelocarpon superellum]